MHTCMCVCVRACYFITSQQSSLGSVIYHKPTNPPTHPCPPTTTPPPTHPYSYNTHPSPHPLHPSTNSFTYAPQPHSTHTVILTHTHTHTHTPFWNSSSRLSGLRASCRSRALPFTLSGRSSYSMSRYSSTSLMLAVSSTSVASIPGSSGLSSSCVFPDGAVIQNSAVQLGRSRTCVAQSTPKSSRHSLQKILQGLIQIIGMFFRLVTLDTKHCYSLYGPALIFASNLGGMLEMITKRATEPTLLKVQYMLHNILKALIQCYLLLGVIYKVFYIWYNPQVTMYFLVYSWNGPAAIFTISLQICTEDASTMMGDNEEQF